MFEVLNSRAVVQITGIDAQKFLQPLVTNDIMNNIYSYNYLLNNQGRYLFDFFVYKNNSKDYIIDVEQFYVQQLIKRFSLYKLRSNIEINDISDKYNILYSHFKQEQDIAEYSYCDPRYSKLGFRSLVETSNINKLNAEAKNLYLIDKYEYTIVDGNIDLIQEKSIPLEYGANELNAISYTKGCYIGQEVISRVNYQGEVRKKIYKLVFDSSIDKIIMNNDEIIDPMGNNIGIICSVSNNLAIAIIRKEKYLALQKKEVIVKNYLAKIIPPLWRKQEE